MKLYLTHSSGYDYETELYKPMKEAFGDEYEIFFPHDTDLNGVKSKKIIPTCSLVLAEVSYPSTGQGIELGWADAANVPIICFHRANSEISSALRFISDNRIEYSSTEDMIKMLQTKIQSLS